ncbi:MAG: hypothetical protein Ta2B_08650 [Termitinemataceae bacterium]|nr:MAG: hypothetical protein Ta2B_08650 [Termitinemataceae bacterium]
MHLLRLCLIFSALIYTSCTTSITGAVQRDGSAEISLDCDLGTKITGLLKSFSANSNGQAGKLAKNVPIIDAALLNGSLKKANGIIAVNLRNRGENGIYGGISISKVGELLKSGGGYNFVTFTPGTDGGGKIVINISLNNSSQILLAVSEDFHDYLSALMAPCATGENLTKTEYLKAVADVYGKDIAAEINTAHFKANITFPKDLKTIKGGTKNGKTASFDIALIDILVLDNSLVYEMQW